MGSREVVIPQTKFYLHMENQWPGLVQKTNWTDFTFIVVEFEYAPYLGNVDFVLGILGFVFTFTYTYNMEIIKDIYSLKDKLEAELDAKVEDPLGILDKLEDKE